MSRNPVPSEVPVSLPSEGGSYIRDPDGSLTRLPDGPILDVAAEDQPDPIPAEEA
jgi:hypothetical protein